VRFLGYKYSKSNVFEVDFIYVFLVSIPDADFLECDGTFVFCPCPSESVSAHSEYAGEVSNQFMGVPISFFNLYDQVLSALSNFLIADLFDYEVIDPVSENTANAFAAGAVRSNPDLVIRCHLQSSSFSIRSTASCIRSTVFVSAKRRYPSPCSPKPMPGVATMPAFSKRIFENSIEV